jgi:hypothetical protein
LGKGSEKVGERTRLACCFRRLAENDYIEAIRSRATGRLTVHANGVRSPLEYRKCSVDPTLDLFFPEHFEQMIKTRSHRGASRGEPCGVDDCAEFYA